MEIKPYTDDILSVSHRIKNNDLFKNANISESDFSSLKLNILTLKTGEILFRHEDPANSIYLVLEGEINLINEQNSGKTHLCLPENKFLGHEEYFLQTNRKSIAIALKDTYVAELTQKNIEILLTKDNSFLDNIKYPSNNFDNWNKGKFENGADELPAFEEISSVSPTVEFESTDNEKSTEELNNKVAILDSTKIVYNKIDLSKIRFEIETIINKFNENLLIVEDEKLKTKALRDEYENDNMMLLVEIEKLKESESKLNSLNKEKTEILSRQSYRIIELENELSKYIERESSSLKKIEVLSEEILKSKTIIKKLEADSVEKEALNSQLEIKFNENKKTISELIETRSQLTERTKHQEKALDENKSALENAEKKIEDLTFKLSTKELTLAEINKDLQAKTSLLSTLNDNLSKAIAELRTKDGLIENQSLKIRELQNNLDFQLESEKNKNDYIISNACKIAEYEDILANLKNELNQKNQSINNLIRDTKELTEKVSEKQNLIIEQNRAITDLSNEKVTLQKSAEDFGVREKALKEEIANLEFHLSKANSKLISVTEQAKEKEVKVEKTEKDKLDIQKNFEELKSTLNKKEDKIIDLERVVSRLVNELSEAKKLNEESSSKISELASKTGEYNQLRNENHRLSTQIIQLQKEINDNVIKKEHLLSLNSELEKLKSEYDTLLKEHYRLKEDNRFLSEHVKELKLQTEKSNKENIDSSGLIDELKKLRLDLESKTSEINSLKNENNFLSEKVNAFRLRIEESKKYSLANEELDKLKSEREKFVLSITEKDKIIEEQQQKIDKIKLAQNEELKIASSLRQTSEKELRIRDEQIIELQQNLKSLQTSLDEKTFNENHLSETIENQAQKIAQLELMLNDSDAKLKKFGTGLIINVSETHSESKTENQDTSSKDGILYKAQLISKKYANTPFPDECFEHYLYFDVHIVNVNLTRATLDAVSAFNDLLKEIISNEKSNIVINLSQCEFIDSSILGVLVSNLKKVTAKGGDLRLAALQPTVHSMMELTRMYRIFESFPSIELAVQSFE